jgi:phage shock protein PspC (stress-responsive transcriptional regulator)
MRRVVTISLNGTAYQLEEAGCDALRRYLDEAEAKLRADPDCAEILADLEQAIGEKCARCLHAHRNVVSSEDVARILTQMGPVDGGQDAMPPGDRGAAAGAAGGGTAGAATAGAGTAAKRLYQISEGALISGVCNGIAAYLGVDVIIVRVIFVALALLTWGAWIIVYLVLMFVIPYASTSEDHAAAHGLPFTAQQLVEQAKRQYAQFKQNAGRRHDSHRQWRWQRRQWRQQWRHERWAMRQRGRWADPAPGDRPAYATQLLAGVLVPIAALINAVLVIALLVGIAQLLARGSLYGWPRPAGMPVWIGIVALCILYGALATPLRALRHAAYFARGAGPSAWVALCASLLWLAFMALFLWMAWHFWPQLQLLLQQLGDSLRATRGAGQAI